VWPSRPSAPPRTLVHGDIHDGQLLADGDRLTGIIDWETARTDHPYWDLDPGQWGTGR
jgi:aminoglycoside phosphotransferase (APT) family kinase protein